MEITNAIKAAAQELGLTIHETDETTVRNHIAACIREMIHSDFQKLVNLLYRMDVSEEKLRLLLENNPDKDAGELITTLIIERQVQKIKSKKEFRQPPPDSNEELW